MLLFFSSIAEPPPPPDKIRTNYSGSTPKASYFQLEWLHEDTDSVFEVYIGWFRGETLIKEEIRSVINKTTDVVFPVSGNDVYTLVQVYAVNKCYQSSKGSEIHNVTYETEPSRKLYCKRSCIGVC